MRRSDPMVKKGLGKQMTTGELEEWEEKCCAGAMCAQARKKRLLGLMEGQQSSRTDVAKREVRKGFFRCAGDTCIEERSECDESKSC